MGPYGICALTNEDTLVELRGKIVYPYPTPALRYIKCCEIHFAGWRLTRNEASILPPDTVLTLPKVATANCTAFSMAVHLKPVTDTKINLLNSAIVFDAATNLSLTIRFVREIISKFSD